jgi:hypothetical protein
MSLLTDARQLANYITLLDDFSIDTTRVVGYQHMGAMLADAVLQAGLNYRTVVQPRVRRILMAYPEARTVSGLCSLISSHGASAILDWRNWEKPRRFEELTTYLHKARVDTEDDLKGWLLLPKNCYDIQSIKGIGPKTVDYLKNLTGFSTIAVDRHVRRFVTLAGIRRNEYEEIRKVVSYAADLLSVSRCNLDHAIWSYLSGSE